MTEEDTLIRQAVQWMRRLRAGNQKGFTLIEMLVVISILGILAAVVTIGTVGAIGAAQARADDAEKGVVQVALDTMSSELELQPSQVCPDTSTPTNNMAAFPVGGQRALYPRYLRSPQFTHRAYRCDSSGTVTPAG